MRSFNKNRRDFLTLSAKTGLCIVCGGIVSQTISSCNKVEEGEPVLPLHEYPELQKIGGAIKKRYSKLNNSEPILIIHLSENNFVAYSALCTHKGVEVRLPVNNEIVCPNHGSRFKVTDGQVIEGKAIEPLKKFNVEFNESKQQMVIKEM